MPSVKNAAGLYGKPGMDLIDLFIGCEGILGIVTEATLRLAPRPEETISEIAFFDTEEQALAFVDDMRKAAHDGVPVLSLEYFDGNSLRFMQHPAVRGEHAAAVYTEIAGDMDQAEALLEALEAHEVAQDWFAETAEDRKEQREFRHSLPEGVNSYVRRHGSHKVGTDLVVPPDRFPEMVAMYRQIGAEFTERCPHDQEHWLIFGHIGNYHLHFNFLARNTDELEVAGELYARLAQAAIAMGGTISGEHGVGKKTIVIEGERVPYLQVMYGTEGLEQNAATKRALDPKWTLNPGNMVKAER
jgi:D-lactate dehydrogenase (cytochrome)